MNKYFKIFALSTLLMASAACTRIESGHVGVRIGMDKQIETEELQAGTLNQVIFGDVLTFPYKEVKVDVGKMTPLAADNSTIAELDAVVIYNINPNSAADIYIQKNRGFHAYNEESGDTLLLYNYIQLVAKNATYKVARKYESLKMNDNRAQMEIEIKESIDQTLKEEKLAGEVTISQVLIKQITPASNIVASANALVQAQNDQKRKQVEVGTAKLEAERIAALNANAGATKYMEATAQVTIAEAIREGKVKTIVVPWDFKGIVNTGN